MIYDKDRHELITRIAKRIDTFAEHVGYGDPDATRQEAESYVAEIEESLTTRAAPEPDDDAVERAAKAMCEYALADAEAWDKYLKNYGRNGMPGKAYYRDMARAALKAAGSDADAVMSCPNCSGTGQYDDCTCSVCEGDGELLKRHWGAAAQKRGQP